MDNVEERILAHLQGTETDEAARELSEWIRESPANAKQFAEIALMHGQLRGLLSGEASLNETRGIGCQPVVRDESTGWQPIPLIVAAMAACLLIAVGFAWFRNGDHGGIAEVAQANEKIIATLVQSSDARWDGASINEGSPLHAQTLSLRSGLVRLEFASGVEVTLRGPAEYQVIDVGRTRLLSGLLTAIVPPGAEGFQVDTPTAEVIDLGTVFGIELDDVGGAKVSVFDGEVEVRPTSSPDKRLVQEGEAVRVINTSEVESSEFDGATFEKVWPVSSGIVGSTGAFRFAPQWPRRLRFVQSDSEVFVLPEGYAQTLDEPIAVNITTSGVFRTQADLTDVEIPAGTRVKCFLLQFNPIEQGNGQGQFSTERPDTSNLNPDDLKRVVGEITFDRPVLGLIVRGDDLRSSDGVFSERGGRIPQKGRALELYGTPRDDIISLSEDRRTVKLDLSAFGFFSDHVRVILDQPLVANEQQEM